MASLYETLSDAQQGEAIAALGREFGLTQEQTQAAVESLCLPYPWVSSNRRRHPKVWVTCLPSWDGKQTFTGCMMIQGLPFRGRDAPLAMRC